MAPAEADEIILLAHEVQTCRRGLFDTDCMLAKIADFCAPRDDVILGKHPVQQAHLKPADGILQQDFQRFCLIVPRMHGRKSFQCIFPLINLMAGIAQVTVLGTVRIANHKRRIPVIPCPKMRVLLRQDIHRICPVISGIRRVS